MTSRRLTLDDLPPRAQAEVRAQLQTTPRPKPHPAGILAPARPVRDRPERKPVRKPKVNATAFFVAAGLRAPVAEHRFTLARKWRFDYAWPALMVALEVEGGVWTGGRHTRGAGFLKDCEKYNRAAVLGWRMLRVTPQDLCTAETVAMLREVLE